MNLPDDLAIAQPWMDHWDVYFASMSGGPPEDPASLQAWNESRNWFLASEWMREIMANAEMSGEDVSEATFALNLVAKEQNDGPWESAIAILAEYGLEVSVSTPSFVPMFDNATVTAVGTVITAAERAAWEPDDSGVWSRLMSWLRKILSRLRRP